MSKKLRNILIIATLAVVILLVVARQLGWVGEDEGLKVSTAEVKEMTLVETVVASGKIQPEVEVKISSEVSGEIIELPIREGQEVEQGDLLLRINPDIYQAAVNRARAALNSAKSALASAKAQLREVESNYRRNKQLHEQGVISNTEWDAAQRAYEVAQLNVESAKYQLESAEATYNEALDNLKRTTIYAPQSGTVSMLKSEVGERVVGTATMTGTEIARIANLENMEVLVEVNENDIIRVSRGDTAVIEVDAYLGREFKGVVTEIANSAQLEGVSADQVTNFEVKVRILKKSYEGVVREGEKSPFRPGMTASVEIRTNRKENVTAVPIEAVTTRTDTARGAKSFGRSRGESGAKTDFEVVFLFKDGRSELQVVETGIQDDESIEIVSGLKIGQEVITGPYSLVSKMLKNGDPVVREGEGKNRRKQKDTD